MKHCNTDLFQAQISVCVLFAEVCLGTGDEAELNPCLFSPHQGHRGQLISATTQAQYFISGCI